MAAALAGGLLAGCGGGEEATSPASDAAAPAEVDSAAVVSAMADSWDGRIRYGAPYDALDPGLRRSAGPAAAATFDPTDDYWGLPRAEGYEEVFYACSGCHSLRLVMQQRSTPERWDYLLDWMVDSQGMAPLPPEERDLVHAYLSAQFGPGPD
jgi:hypothetical protein